MKKVKDATSMDSWKLIRWLEIFTLPPVKASNSQILMYMICWYFKTQKDSFNISHKINKLAFGDYFPGVVNPLDGTPSVLWIQKTRYGMYQYFIKVVPTVYTDISGHSIHSNQFSVTEHFRGAEVGFTQSIPGVFFFFDLSPIKVTFMEQHVSFMEQHVSFLHFLANVCAIVGGIFTVSGILDSFIYHGQKAMKKKMELGKFS